MALAPKGLSPIGPDLRTRLLSALVMMAVALAAVIAGGFVFAAFAAVGSGLVLLEWARISGPFSVRRVDRAALVLVVVSVFCAVWDPTASLAILAAVALAFVIARPADPRLPWLGAGLLYAGYPGVAAIVLRGPGEMGDVTVGLVALAFVFVVVWATDSVAYFAGRSIGGPKLWPKISPKKTWSGAIGGLIGAILAGEAVIALGGLTTFGSAGLVAAILSIVSQAGDLFESALKRHFGVKDSGSIIPGHGGIMDRVDGLVVALVAAAAIGWVRADGGEIAAGLIAW